MGFSSQNFLKAMPLNVESLSEIIEYASKEGYQFVEVRDQFVDLTNDDCKALAEAGIKNKIDLIYVFNKNPLDSGFFPVFEKALANVLVFKGPGILRSLASKSEFDADAGKKGWTSDELNRLAKISDSCAAICKSKNIRFVFENSNEAFFGDSLNYFGLADLLDKTSGPGLQLDIANLFRNSARVKNDPEKVLEYLPSLGNRWVETHLKTVQGGEAQTILTDNPIPVEKIVEMMGKQNVQYVALELTAYGDLSAHAGASFVELNDHAVCNSMGIGNVNIEKLHSYLYYKNAVGDYSLGLRDGKEGQIIRLGFKGGGSKDSRLPAEFVQGLRQLGSGLITTTVHDNYFMFIKVNYRMSVSPTNRDQVALAELLIRQNQYKTLELFKKYLPGCENAFIARTSPSLNIRLGRTITCDYDITIDDVVQGRHFDDDIMAYGFHDEAPRYKIKNGGSYGVPYKALIVKDIDNLYAAGMMITTDFHAHMSTRNTVCCMGQGQAAGIAAAICVAKKCETRALPNSELRDALIKNNVYLEG